MSIPLLAKITPQMSRYLVDYGELRNIIELYVVGSSFSGRLLIEIDSLLAIRSLSPHGEDLSELGSLA